MKKIIEKNGVYQTFEITKGGEEDIVYDILDRLGIESKKQGLLYIRSAGLNTITYFDHSAKDMQPVAQIIFLPRTLRTSTKIVVFVQKQFFDNNISNLTQQQQNGWESCSFKVPAS